MRDCNGSIEELELAPLACAIPTTPQAPDLDSYELFAVGFSGGKGMRTLLPV
jgi:hypothetical protein